MKQEMLESLAQELAACRECPLREAAQAPVGWFGNYDSPIVFVGEGCCLSGQRIVPEKRIQTI